MSKSKIFLFLCLFFIAGIFLSSIINIPQLVWLGILILGIILISIWWRDKRRVILGFCLLALVGGIYKYSQSGLQVYQSTISDTNDNETGLITLSGIVSEDPEIRKDKIKLIVNSSRGKILIITSRYPEYQYGDQLEIIGKLKRPKVFNDFDYKSYLAKDNIYWVIYYPEIKVLGNKGDFFHKALFNLKNNFEDKINSLLSEPQASFLAGLILGEKRGIPQQTLETFNQTGTTHLIALSGYNITIIALILMTFLGFLTVSPRYSFWLTVLAIVSFTIMTGASPSVVRAAVMGILVLIARREGRFYNPINALVFAGTVMVFLNPKILRFDLSFQLSFLATLGLIYFSPLLEKKLKELPNFLSFRESLVSTLSAQIFVLPLILSAFGRLSLIAPLANVLVLPAIPLTMLGGFLTGLFGFIYLPLAKIFSWFVWLFLTYEIKIIELLSKIPFASVKLHLNWIWLALYYLIIVYWVRRAKEKSPTLGDSDVH